MLKKEEILIAMVRHPDGLFGMINAPKYRFELSLRPGQRDQPYEELNDFYHFREVPIDRITSREFVRKRVLVRSWNRLADSHRPEHEILSDLMVVLLETQPSLRGPGNTRQTNTSRKKLLSDLQLKCCRPRSLQPVLDHLLPFQRKAVRVLKHLGYDAGKITDRIFRSAESGDAHLAYRFPRYKDVSSLPADFRKYLLPLLQKAPANLPGRALRFFRTLSLEDNPKLLAAVSRMAASRDFGRFAFWCSILETIAPEHRSVYATVLLESGAFLMNTRKANRAILESASAPESGKKYPLKLLFVLEAMKQSVHPNYIRAGLELAPQNRVPDRIDQCNDFPWKRVEEISLYLASYRPAHRSIGYDLWKTCGRLKGFPTFLKNLPFRNANPAVLYLFLLCFTEFCKYSSPSDVQPASIEFLRQATDIWKEMLGLDGPYQRKYIDHIQGSVTRADLPFLKTRLPALRQILIRISRPPYLKNSDILPLLSVFLSHTGQLRNAFVSAPDSSFRHLEDVYFKGDQYATGKGLRSMMQIAPLLTVKCFRHFPRKLMKISQQLGLLSEGLQKQIMVAFLRHPLMKTHFKKMTLQEMVGYLRKFQEYSSPVPKTLQKNLYRSDFLTPSRKRRYRNILLENLHLTRLEVLEDSIESTLKKDYPEASRDQSEVLHTLMMIGASSRNRRVMKRFWRSYWRHDFEYVVQHANSRAWLSGHPELDFPLWQKGIDFERKTEKYGWIRIAVEQDPAEALKLGTYVKSCLALGGSNQEAASAVVLDINKQVLYARDEKNRVVARQLIAYSEEEQLVCFQVYPADTEKELIVAFRRYDIQFAEALGVTLRRQDQSYTIAAILSREWYDDYPWNPTK